MLFTSIPVLNCRLNFIFDLGVSLSPLIVFYFFDEVFPGWPAFVTIGTIAVFWPLDVNALSFWECYIAGDTTPCFSVNLATTKWAGFFKASFAVLTWSNIFPTTRTADIIYCRYHVAMRTFYFFFPRLSKKSYLLIWRLFYYSLISTEMSEGETSL